MNRSRTNAWDYGTGVDRWSKILNCKWAAENLEKDKEVFGKWIL
jgi:hypothetical protein